MSQNKIVRILSIFLCLALLVSNAPLTVRANTATENAQTVADPGTAHTWEDMMGTDTDGNRYSGRVWVDKSVYTDGQTVLLDTAGRSDSTYRVSLEPDEAFQVVFSALGSSMTTTTTSSSTGPMDVVLVLDTSTSMDDTSGGITRLQRVIEAANLLLADLVTVHDIRLGIVTYNAVSETVLPLDRYTNGLSLKVNNYYNNGRAEAGVVYAYDSENTLLGKDSGYTTGTNLQAGINRGFRLLSQASQVEGRVPVAIVLTDGQANRSVYDNWYNIVQDEQTKYNTTAALLGTLLNAAYNKVLVEKHYDAPQMVYTVSVDMDSTESSHALMNPADASNGFNSYNDNREVARAYSLYTTWAAGRTATYDDYTYDHGYTQLGDVTRQQIIDRIEYADVHFDVSSAQLSQVFDQIYEELTSGVFNPITTGSTQQGGTGVRNTPLIYVDTLGKYMQIKQIQSVTLFGASYGVTANGDGTYTVHAGTGVNPTTNEAYNTSEDISITVTDNADHTQTLRIYINQEILPILLDQVISDTVGDVTNATITQYSYNPLRVYYTVGISQDILLENGQIDVAAIADDYPYIDNTTGQITFYSNDFNTVNTADASGQVTLGDAHVGFQPSPANRYYYHQANQGIFSAVSAKDGSAINWNASEYGVLYEEDKYNLTYLSYDQYQTMADDQTVYTYVSYYRPTESTSDAANAAQQVTYLVYTNWGYLKESVAFYDRNAGVFVNYASGGYATGDKGYAIAPELVEATIGAYLAANPGADIKAMLGVGSLRTSRLHNMTVEKSANNTQTAVLRVAPEYTYDTAENHNGNSVVNWLGNNGRLVATVDTGIALTKQVTQAIGDPSDTYALTVTVPAGVSATPVVLDDRGNDVTDAISAWANNVLTVQVRAGQTVYITGIPGGTQCQVAEQIPAGADYYLSGSTGTVTVPLLSQVLAGAPQFTSATVTNAPYQYGDLYITKSIVSDHGLPQSILQEQFAVQVELGAQLAGRSFSMETTDDTGAVTAGTCAADENGRITLQLRARQTVAILGLPAGTPVTVTEVLTAQQSAIFQASYSTQARSRRAPGAQLTIQANTDTAVMITNTYKPLPTQVTLDIAGTKVFTAESGATLPGGSFRFVVQQQTDGQWTDISDKTAQVSYAAGESGTKTFTIPDVLQGITFDRVGSWAYQVLEVKGSVENVTYDRTLYTFTVTVTDQDGQLVATVTDLNNAVITGGSYQVTFQNTYHTAPVSLDITKNVVNASGDPQISKAGFRFVSAQTDEQWNILDGGARSVVHTDGAGEARLTATYTEAGVYYYLVWEENDARPGWQYSDTVYAVTVTVTEENGNLAATLAISPRQDSLAAGEQCSATADTGSISFTNTYDPGDATVDLDGVVRKVLTGAPLTEGMFTFQVTDGAGNVMLTGTNRADGTVDFNGVLRLNAAGSYTYTISEVNGGQPGMTYDPNGYSLVVEVRNDPATGTLQHTSYFVNALEHTVTFQNTYTPTPTSYALGGVKDVLGRAVNAGEFRFSLYQGDTLLETVTNTANGSFAFRPISYTQAGTYTYTIREEQGNLPGITYTGADNPVTVTVTVTDRNSILSASASLSNEQIRFENTYRASSAALTFRGEKTLVGADLTDGMFTFDLYLTDNTYNIATGTKIGSVQNTDGAFAFETLYFSRTGSYFYAIVENSQDPVENVVYDGSQYNFFVQVTDPGQGQRLLQVRNVSTGNTVGPAVSVTQTVSFTNAMTDAVTEKQVYLQGNTQTQIDGQKVDAGDILTYYICYTNYTGKDAVVDIMDTLPMYTSYVEGSASHGGSYVGSHVNWILNVGAGQSVRVSFSVRVDEADVIVANTAYARDGVNTYVTNEVTNHTVDHIVSKDVARPDAPTVSIDGDKVYNGQELLYTVRYFNTSTKPVTVTVTDAIPRHTAYVEGSASHDGVYADGVLTWNVEVAAGKSITVSFRVRVDTPDSQTVINQAQLYDGKNSYTTNPVSNYTSVGQLTKDVFAENEPTVSIDGQTVYGGDKLVYAITYTNPDPKPVTVQLADPLPAHTTYVEGSASHGGVLTEGVLTWTVEVGAGESVTVHFTVQVAKVSGAALTNRAYALEGENTYTSNPVTNDTYYEEPGGPETGDGANLVLWSALAGVSALSIVAVLLWDKKRSLLQK